MRKTIILLLLATPLSLLGQAWHEEGLVAYYPLDGKSLNDSSHSQEHLIDSTGIQSTADRFGAKSGAVFFDKHAYISGSSTHLPDSMETRSFSLWINIKDTTEPVAFVFFYGRRAPGRGMGLGITSDRKLFFSGFLVNLQTSVTVPLNKWLHVGLSFDGDTAMVYINGILTSAGLVNGAWFTENLEPELNLGYLDRISATFVDPYHGAIDDFRVYNRELSPTEMQKLAQDDFSPHVGLAEKHMTERAGIYPNPVTHQLHINYKDVEDVRIHDLSGREAGKYGNTSKIDLSHLEKGCYLISFKVDQQIFIRKFNKE